MKQAFTLVEILVVVTIIGMIAGIGVLSYGQISKQSRDGRRKSDLENIRSALEMYRSGTDIGYPIMSIGCGQTDPIGVYLPKTPQDPKCPDKKYYYKPLNSSGTECTTAPCIDYTLGTNLELDSGSSCIDDGCGTTIDCNYCVGPYGKK